MRLGNTTACAEAEAFVRKEAATYRTARLSVSLKYARSDSAPIRGRFNRREARILVLVDAVAQVPFLLRYPIRTQGGSGGHFWWIYDEELAESLEELVVWTFFHEFHHFLCHSGQAQGDWETKANAYGFEMLRKYKSQRLVTVNETRRTNDESSDEWGNGG